MEWKTSLAAKAARSPVQKVDVTSTALDNFLVIVLDKI